MRRCCSSVRTVGHEHAGWRIPFLLGILIAPVGFYIRSQLDDTIDVNNTHATSRTFLAELMRHHLRDFLFSTACTIGPTISVYIVSSYMTAY